MEKLQSLRRRRVMSIGDLADAAGVGRNTISRIENGRIVDARPSTIRKIAKALRVDAEELVREE